MTIFHKIALYPTIYYGVALEFLGFRTRYTRVDKHCILGALPFRRDSEHLIKNENVKAVLTLNEPHELKLSPSKTEWETLGVEYLRISITDYYGVASVEQIHQAVSYINSHKEKDNCVYVHCKAGRYRSALIVACYLLNNNPHFTSTDVIQHLTKLRPYVILDRKRQIDAMNSYRKFFKF